MPTIQQTLSKVTRRTEEQLAREKSIQFKYPYANLEGYPANFEILSLISKDQAAKWKAVPYSKQGNRVRMGIVHPENKQTLNWLHQLANEQQITINLTVISDSSLSYMLGLYEDLLAQKETYQKEEQARVQEAAKHDYIKLVKSREDLVKYAQNISTTELLDLILAAAVNLRASDIHLEPAELKYFIRFRIDGVLQPAVELPTSSIKPLVSRIKMHANIKLDLSGQPQDGRFSMHIGQQDIDFRVSSLPSQYGESVVIRILRQDIQKLSLEELGFNQRDFKLIEEAIHKPYGMIIITGPTGSGKTTTLYAILNKLNTPEKKIITLEDPIEYRLAGIEQSQIDSSRKYSFADALRAALRQDPDIIMLGEIRDEETARVALNAALTGHLVLTTVHANNAVMAMPRLVDMNIEPFFLSGSINLIVAQRLVRTLKSGSIPDTPEYKGRTVISEVLRPSAKFERAVIKKEDFSTLLQIATQDGMITMIEDGNRKVKANITTHEEVLRVSQEANL